MGSAPLVQSVCSAVAGLVFSFVLYFVLRKLSSRLDLKIPNLGTGKTFLVGLGIGLVASFLSGLLYWRSGDHTMVPSELVENLHISALGNIFPASIEETGFRGGVVAIMSGLFGKSWGIASGSIPFGVLHFVGKIFGNPITVQHAIGASAAGLLLSLLYIKYSLAAAFACHWVWNTLCGSWVRALSIPQPGAVQAFEGAWSTIAVLTVLSLLLFIGSPRLMVGQAGRI